MCGIAGYISLCRESDSVVLAHIESMLELIAHRGPNQRGIHVQQGAGIGMYRLSIIDQEHHQIPYFDRGNRYALVFNGEIYNHVNVRGGLPADIDYHTRSDSETCLYAMMHQREQALLDFNGMYAFAFWDLQRQSICLVRDKAGEKPLYVVKTDRFVAFCSELKGLLTLVEPVERMTPAYRAYEFCFGRETLIPGVELLEPGSFLEIERTGECSVTDYWKPWKFPLEIPDCPERILNDLTDLIVDSIRLRTNNLAHAYGCFTSGGIDSALIACIARPHRLYYCHYALGKAFDELHYAKMIAEAIGTELTVIEPAKEDFERTRKSIAWHLDTPCTWTSFSIWMILEKLHPEIKVIMSGEGADEMFGGYHRYHLLHHDEQIHRLQAMEEYQYLIQKYYGSPEERYARLVNRCDNRYDRETAEFVESEVHRYFQYSQNDVVHAMGLHDFYTTMQVLLQMSDRMCMAFSIENRSPYLDHRLIQYAFHMPSQYKIRDGKTKWVLKQIAEKFIPEAIARRVDKRGFSAPVNIWYGWDKAGQYNRSIYRDMVYQDWKATILNGNSRAQ